MIEPFAYDQVDYPSLVHPQMHPSRLAAIARLHGIPAASPRACRLLEVGCGDGLQLITLAMAYPDAHFVGVDLAANAIGRGEQLRKSLGLDNLQLVAADLMQWQPGPQPYDYVLAHGFYSWVPEPVRQRLLQLCNGHLGVHGIAYISYNALPGGHLRRMLWDIMQFHVGPAQDAAASVERARECLDLLLLGMPENTRYRTTLAGEIADLKARFNPHVLFHDDLAAINDPCTLDQFMRAARSHELGFVAEASYHEMSLHNAHPDARAMLEEVARDDLVTKEQYLDFFTGRRFRQTILCRSSANPRPGADPSAIAELALVTELESSPQLSNAQAGMRFTRPSSGGLETDDTIVQAMLVACGSRHPQSLPVTSLAQAARVMADVDELSADDMRRVYVFLLRAFEAGLVELHVDAPDFSRTAPVRPTASPLARRQAAAGEAQVTSLRPLSVQLEDPVTCSLLLALDGTRDRDAILSFMRERLSQAREGEQPVGGAGVYDPDTLKTQLDAALARMAALALLCADTGNPEGPRDQRTR